MHSETQHPQLLTTVALAKLLALTPDVVRHWRMEGGRGPKFLKIGRTVRYSPQDVAAWLEASQRASTEDAN